jgi:hypothetical protein
MARASSAMLVRESANFVSMRLSIGRSWPLVLRAPVPISKNKYARNHGRGSCIEGVRRNGLVLLPNKE